MPGRLRIVLRRLSDFQSMLDEEKSESAFAIPFQIVVQYERCVNGNNGTVVCPVHDGVSALGHQLFHVSNSVNTIRVASLYFR